MQHTQQDETILRTEPKEDIDDLISAPIPAGWSVSDKTARPRAVFPATLFTISTLLDII